MEAIGGIKIFTMNDSEWYAGASADDALKGMAENLGFEDIEACRAEYCTDGPIVELDEDELETKTFVDEAEDGSDGEKRTFRAQLTQMIANGEEFPCFFASTEF
jgi:hypothetical protein